jgi:hypothetical protein
VFDQFSVLLTKRYYQLALKILIWVGASMAIYIIFGEVAIAAAAQSAILFDMREPVMWAALFRLVMIVWDNDLAFRSKLKEENPSSLT